MTRTESCSLAEPTGPRDSAAKAVLALELLAREKFGRDPIEEQQGGGTVMVSRRLMRRIQHAGNVAAARATLSPPQAPATPANELRAVARQTAEAFGKMTVRRAGQVNVAHQQVNVSGRRVFRSAAPPS